MDERDLPQGYQYIPEKHRIDRVHKIKPEDFVNNYYLPLKPVILTGLANEWPAFQLTLGSDYIRLSHLYVERYNSGQPINAQELGFPHIDSDFETIPYIRHFGPLTAKNSNKILYDDLDTPCMFPDPAAYELRDFLFMGLPGTKTEIHYDGTHNFVSIVKGQKHVALLPPGDHPSMFVGATQKQLDVWTTKTVFPIHDPPSLALDPSLLTEENRGSHLMMHEHPNLKDTEGLQYSPVRAGEIIFFPAHWFHYIHNVDLSISITTQTYKMEW